MPSNFDHRKCPNCVGSTMRLTRVEPHNPDREDGYERHVYHCAECTNVSRFVFEVSPTVRGRFRWLASFSPPIRTKFNSGSRVPPSRRPSSARASMVDRTSS